MATVNPDGRERVIEGAGTSAGAWRADAALMAVPVIDCVELIGAASRVVIVAPHPDDEILACGGLLQQLGAMRIPVTIVAVTDGEASHPGSATWTRARLQEVRPDETMAALAALGLDEVPVTRLELPDGSVASREPDLARALTALIAPGDLLLTTWRTTAIPTMKPLRAHASRLPAHAARRWSKRPSGAGTGAVPATPPCRSTRRAG